MKILAILALLFFSVGCTGSIEDLISDLEDYEYEEGYECYEGDARLPFGTHPEYLVTPEGYEWKCEGGSTHSIRFHSDGTVWFTLTSQAYSNQLEYWHDCGGHPGSPHLGQTGEWIIDETDRLCVQYDNLQPGIYNCQEFTYESGILTGSDYADFYDDNGDYLGREYSDYGADVCTLTEE